MQNQLPHVYVHSPHHHREVKTVPHPNIDCSMPRNGNRTTVTHKQNFLLMKNIFRIQLRDMFNQESP